VLLGESGGVGCSSGLVDLSVSGSLRSCLNGIAICHGDSCRFPVIGEGCLLDQLGGPSLLTNGSSSVRGCLGNGVVRMGGIRGSQDDEATGGEDSILSDNSFHFPVTGSDWTCFHSGGVSTGSGIGPSGRNDDEATGGDIRKVISLKGGVSHGRGMWSRDEGPMCFFIIGLIGGNGISSGIGDLFHGAGMMGVASLIGGDGVSDWGSGMLTGSSMIMGIGSYCSIDEYCR